MEPIESAINFLNNQDEKQKLLSDKKIEVSNQDIIDSLFYVAVMVADTLIRVDRLEIAWQKSQTSQEK